MERRCILAVLACLASVTTSHAIFAGCSRTANGNTKQSLGICPAFVAKGGSACATHEARGVFLVTALRGGDDEVAVRDHTRWSRLEKALECAVCTSFLFQPVTLPDCGHSFCAGSPTVSARMICSATNCAVPRPGCLRKWVNEVVPRQLPYCPVCRGLIRSTHMTQQHQFSREALWADRLRLIFNTAARP